MRPFLGPLHAWVSACPGESFRRIWPWFACSGIDFSPHQPEALAQVTWRALPRRRQEGKIVVLGSWSLEFGEDPLQARWFSLQLTQEDVPYLFDREPYRAIATLELFAALVGLMVLVPREVRGQLGVRSFSSGNGQPGEHVAFAHDEVPAVLGPGGDG